MWEECDVGGVYVVLMCAECKCALNIAEVRV